VRPPDGRGSPALGFATSGTFAYGRIAPMKRAMSSGPVEQLHPTAPAPRACRVTSAVRGSVPLSVRPSRSKVMVTIVKRSQVSCTAMSAARASWMSIIVSMTNPSTPPSRSPRTCSLKTETASSKSRSPKGWMKRPVGPMSPRTSALPRTASLAASARLRFTAGTSCSPYWPSLRRFAPKVQV